MSRSALYYTPVGASAANLALMRLLGLEAIYRKPRTSVAHLQHRVYPYLLRGFTIDRTNQV